MDLFNKRAKTNNREGLKFDLGEIENLERSKREITNKFGNNIRTLKDLMAPSGLSEVDKNTLMINSKFIRNYVMQGYPDQVHIGWLNELYDFPGDMDTLIYFEPSETRAAIDELTAKITQLQAQLDNEEDSGHIRNSSKYRTEIGRLIEERKKIEGNNESLFGVNIFSNVSAPSFEKLNDICLAFEDRCKAKRMIMVPTTLRMEDGFKSSLPTMDMYYKDKLRNFNTGGIIGCFPFYDAELTHPDGIYIGRNLSSDTLTFLDVYDKKKLNNTNINMFGCVGAGKSYGVSLIMMRSILKGVRHGIIDPEGEYVGLTRALGGINIEISPESNQFINFFEIDEEEVLDENGFPTGEKIVNVPVKVIDLSNLISAMARDISAEQQAIVEILLSDMYHKVYQINNDPKSLYENEKRFDPKTGEVHFNGKKKKMPTLSDFHAYMEMRVSEEPKFNPLISIINQLAVFKKDGAYGLFDCETTIDMDAIRTAPIINFNVSKLDQGKLRPIGMYVAMTFLWEKFIKRNPEIRKRVVCDEAWMLISPQFDGSKFTANFLEIYARRIRKRNAGLMCASQHVDEFKASTQGQAVIKNSAVQFFLKQTPDDIKVLRTTFDMSDGELDFIRSADKTGYCLIKSSRFGSVSVKIEASPFEHELIGLKIKQKTNKYPQ